MRRLQPIDINALRVDIGFFHSTLSQFASSQSSDTSEIDRGAHEEACQNRDRIRIRLFCGKCHLLDCNPLTARFLKGIWLELAKVRLDPRQPRANFKNYNPDRVLKLLERAEEAAERLMKWESLSGSDVTLPGNPILLTLEHIAEFCGHNKRWLRKPTRRKRLGNPDVEGRGQTPHKWRLDNKKVEDLIYEHKLVEKD